MKVVLAILLIALPCSSLSQSQQYSPTQSKNSKLSTNSTPAQPAPTANFPTIKEITESIANGIERADKKHDTSHPPTPPDNSGWWFNLFLVGFTGLLVVVGGTQCYLIFWTLKATEIAANAAKDAAEGLPKIERAYLFLEKVTFSTTHSIIHATTDAEGKISQFHITGVDLRFTNHGKTPGIVREVFATVKASNLSSECGQARECELEPIRVVSDDKSFTAVSHSFRISHADYELAQTTGNPYILVFGMIVYQNVLKQECWTKFCWRFSFSQGFRPTIDPEHNAWN